MRLKEDAVLWLNCQKAVGDRELMKVPYDVSNCNYVIRPKH